ncbi:predicted protein [Histoplasma capsulatum G186AR]|uniref:Uncharacterized protein n=1 Tax=Ajellomyces capsulatus (strain G186AR / H82 / ATCC MYA-2454 / RMSCC 2432) TaxID=447093 RepID=C0NBV4_AJECG|nr:uncharacterized protein HCBG_00600 [Histoplasma capsulatum G186AR]EEH11145.1 predicted protein [Histoplasma capsulatum G186AR]
MSILSRKQGKQTNSTELEIGWETAEKSKIYGLFNSYPDPSPSDPIDVYQYYAQYNDRLFYHCHDHDNPLMMEANHTWQDKAKTTARGIHRAKYRIPLVGPGTGWF